VLFVSHANPEDNEFAQWLTLKLASVGYRAWSDVTRLLGGEPVRYAAPLDASVPVLIESVKAQGLEGLVAKRLDSRYEAVCGRVLGRKCVSTAARSS